MSRILLVAGPERDLGRFDRTIKSDGQAFEFIIVNSLREAWRELDTESIAAVLSFPTLDSEDGIHFLQRAKAESPSIATVLLLDPNDSSPINRGHQVGVDQAISFQADKQEEIVHIIGDILKERTRSTQTARSRVLSKVILESLSTLSGVPDLETLLKKLPSTLVDGDIVTLAWTSQYIEELNEFHPVAGEGINSDLLRPMDADEFDLDQDYIQVHKVKSQQASVRIGVGENIYGVLHLYASEPGFERPEKEILRSFARLIERMLSSILSREGEMSTEQPAGSQRTVGESDVDGFEFTRSAGKAETDEPEPPTPKIPDEEDEETERSELEIYAGVLSHELRNYLHKAQSYLEFGEAAGGGDYLKHVQDAHQDIESVLHKAEAVAKREVPSEQREVVSVGVTAENARRRLDAEQMKLEFDEPGNVRANPELLDLLIENLIRNAIQNVGEDVTVTIGGLDDGFYVMDDGPGIPAEIRDRLFEWGFSPGEGGEGIGLAIVKRIVEAHGWRITVTDGDDGGARFEIRDIDVE